MREHERASDDVWRSRHREWRTHDGVEFIRTYGFSVLACSSVVVENKKIKQEKNWEK